MKPRKRTTRVLLASAAGGAVSLTITACGVMGKQPHGIFGVTPFCESDCPDSGAPDDGGADAGDASTPMGVTVESDAGDASTPLGVAVEPDGGVDGG